MGKIRTNQKFRLIAKMLKDIEKASEVFIKSPVHNQMIKYPLVEYGSQNSKVFISTLDDFGDYELSLDKFFAVQADRMDNIFTYWITFADKSEIIISNEW